MFHPSQSNLRQYELHQYYVDEFLDNELSENIKRDETEFMPICESCRILEC